jgi:hypothetical protein
MDRIPFPDFIDAIGGVGNPPLVKSPQGNFYFDGSVLFNDIPSFFCDLDVIFVLSLWSLIFIIIVAIDIDLVLLFRARFWAIPLWVPLSSAASLTAGLIVSGGKSKPTNSRGECERKLVNLPAGLIH